MTRFWTAGLISLPLVALLSGAAPAATDFEDIPYLQARINQVLEREPTGAEVEWRNEATGNSGVIRVLKTYFPSPDAPCRDYERTTRRPGGPGGGESLVRGTGCRDASGRWGLKEMEETEALKTRSPSAEPPTPEAWEAGSPATGGAAETAAPALPGGWAQPSGGQGGTQSQGQSQGQSHGQSQGQSGSAGQGGQTQSSVSTSVLPSVAEPEAAAEAGSEAPEPAAPAPRESASGQPEIELPTRSE
jgi:surface antigen